MSRFLGRTTRLASMAAITRLHRRKSPLACILAALLTAAAASAGPAIGTLSATPSSVTAGVSTPVTITAISAGTPITGGVDLLQQDASGNSLGSLGVMHDDGLNGDAVAGDGTYSLVVSFTPTVQTAAIYLQASAAFKGLLARVKSTVLAIPVTGGGPTISISPPFLTYPAQAVNSTSFAQSLTVTNTGSVSAYISSVTTSGDFAIATDNCISSLPAGGSCNVGVTFTPTATGARSSTVTITDNAAGSPQAVSLSGTGQQPVSLTVLSINPANRTTNFPVTSPIILTFSAPVNPVTVNYSSIPVVVNSINGYPLAGTYTVDGAVVTWTPTNPLPPNTLTNVSVGSSSSVQDLAGNTAQSASSTFITGGTSAVAPPTVTSITPSNGATGVGLSSQIVITFSESMNPFTIDMTSVHLLYNGISQGFNRILSADTRTFTLSGLSFPPSSTVTVVVTREVTDLGGSALVDFESTFTTGPAVAVTAPSIVGQRPATGATQVSANTPIVMFANTPLNAATVPGAIHVLANGQTVNGSVTVTDNGETITFLPSSLLPYAALVTVSLDATAQDLAGDPANRYQATFTVGPNPATTPSVINVSPVSGSTTAPLNTLVHLQYNLAINPATVNGTNAYLQQSGGGNISVALSLDSTGTVLQMAPSAPLIAGVRYCEYVNNLNGVNGIAASNFSACFTTASTSQTSALTVVRISPTDNASNVPVNANLTLIFSGPIDPTTVNGTTVQITGSNQSVVPASVGLTNNNQTVLLKPQLPLPPSTLMTLTLSGVSDIAGNAVQQATHFTTGPGPATVNPGVLAANPVPSATGVPTNTTVSLLATAPIDPASINKGNYYLYDRLAEVTVAGSYSQSSDGMTVYFTPTVPLAAGEDFVAQVFGLTDVAGNSLSCCASGFVNSYIFTTGYSPSSTAPQVTGATPANGVSAIALNANVTIRFNEAVNGQSLGRAVLTSSSGTPVPVTQSFSNGNQTLTLIPMAALAQNTSYTLTVSGFIDQAGNPMSASFTSAFTTGAALDPLTPAAVLEDPGSGATNVPTNAVIRVRFNKQVIVDNSDVVLYPTPGGTTLMVQGASALSADGLNLTFTPAQPLVAETPYCLFLTGVIDLEGQNLTTGNLTCFTTGAGPGTDGLKVLAVSPANGATGAPVNSKVQVLLNEPVSTVSVGNGSVAVSSGGSVVAGSVAANGPTLTWVSAGTLSAGTTYSITVGGFTDLAGNPVTSFSSNFTTGLSAVPDQTGPAVTTFNPVNGASNVTVNSSVTVTFNEPVDPVTINTSSLPIAINVSGAALAGTYSVNGAVVTWTPLTPLPGNTVFSISVSSSVQDLAGNNAQSAVSTFTTAVAANTIVPTVAAVTPANGATGIGLYGQITITFSESMNPSTLNTASIGLLANDAPQSFNLIFSADNRTLTLSNLNLPPSSPVTLTISHAATDLSGNPLADFETQFTTRPVFDISHVYIVSQRPADFRNVPVNVPILIFVNKPLNPSTVPGAVHVTANGRVVSGTTTLTGNGETITFTPDSPLPFGAFVEVFIEPTAQDLNGNPLDDYIGNVVSEIVNSFYTTADPSTAQPTVISLNPMNNAYGVPLNALLQIQYSQPINPSSLQQMYVSLSGTNYQTYGIASLDSTGTVVRVTPIKPLPSSTTVCLTVTNLVGTNGIAAASASSCFTTSSAKQSASPTVTLVQPADGSGNVPINAKLSVTFSGAINPLSVNATTVQVTGSGGTVVPASIRFSNSNQTVSLVPQVSLPTSIQVTLTVAGILDVAGNAVPSRTVHFTTGSAPAVVNPVILAANPSPNATGVPTNSVISLQASVPVDPQSISASTFQITDTTANSKLAGTYSQNTDGSIVFFTPTNPLPANHTISVIFSNSGMADLAGNYLICCGSLPLLSFSPVNNFSFTSGSAPSTTAPQVTGVSPSPSLAGVPINAHVNIQFNEPVNAETFGQITLTPSGGTPVQVSKTLSNGNQTLTLIPLAALAQSTTYTVTVAGVTDQAGNAMTGAFTSNFTAGTALDLTIANVLSVSPQNQAAGVSTNATVQVQFSKQMDALTVSSATFAIFSNGIAVPGTISVSADGSSAVFQPATALSPSTIYTVKISGILDLEDQALTSATTTFTTAAQ